MKDYCLTYQCLETEIETDSGEEAWIDDWVLKLEACLCLDHEKGQVFLNNAMNRVDKSAQCCGNTPLR